MELKDTSKLTVEPGRHSDKGEGTFRRFRNGREKVIDPTFLVAPGGTEHYANFIDAIRSGKNETLNCDIKEGYYSSVLPIMAISYRLGRCLILTETRRNLLMMIRQIR